MEAIGYIGGKEAARHSVSSYGAPAQIRIVPDHKYAPLRANNNDFIFVDADILDADGHHVYNYTDNVTFGVGYPNILFTYMICVACADTYNEKGISLIKKLRNEYFDFAPLRKEGKVETFAETIK